MLYRRLTGSHGFSLRWRGWLEVGPHALVPQFEWTLLLSPGKLVSPSSAAFLLFILVSGSTHHFPF